MLRRITILAGVVAALFALTTPAAQAATQPSVQQGPVTCLPNGDAEVNLQLTAPDLDWSLEYRVDGAPGSGTHPFFDGSGPPRSFDVDVIYSTISIAASDVVRVKGETIQYSDTLLWRLKIGPERDWFLPHGKPPNSQPQDNGYDSKDDWVSLVNTCPPAPAATPKQLKMQARDDLQSAAAGATGDTLKKLNAAIKFLDQSIAKPNWVGEDRIEGKKADQVIELEKKAVAELDKIKDPVPPQVDMAIDKMANADRMLAQTAIDDAIARGGKPDKIAKAQKAFNEGDVKLGQGKEKEAIGKYKEAWKQANSA